MATLISLDSLKALLKKPDDKKLKRSSTIKNGPSKINESKRQSFEEMSRSVVPNSLTFRSSSNQNFNSNLFSTSALSAPIVGIKAKKSHVTQLPSNSIFLNLKSKYVIAKEDAITIEKNYTIVKNLLDYSEQEYRDHFHLYINADGRIFDSSSSNVFLALLPIAIDDNFLLKVHQNSKLVVDNDINAMQLNTNENSISDPINFELWLLGILTYFRQYIMSGLLFERRTITSNFLQKLQQTTRHSFSASPKSFATPASGRKSYSNQNSSRDSDKKRYRSPNDLIPENEIISNSGNDDNQYYSSTHERPTSEPNMMFTTSSSRFLSDTFAVSRDNAADSIINTDGYLPPVRQIVKLSKDKRKAMALQKFYKDQNKTSKSTENLFATTSNSPYNIAASSSSNQNRDINDIANTVQMLRDELNNTKRGLATLDYLVDENISWVTKNVGTNNAISDRSKERCKVIALEKLFDTLGSWVKKSLKKSITKWKKAFEFQQVWDISIKYCKLKAIEKLTIIFTNISQNQLRKGFQPWYDNVQAAILYEKSTSATTINRIVRGFLARRRVKNLVWTVACIKIQSRARVFLARRTRARLTIRRYLDKFARIIQNYFRNISLVSQAKRELSRRRMAKRVIKIQKVLRGVLGRSRFRKMKVQNQKELAEKIRKKKLQAEKLKRKQETDALIEQKRRDDEAKILKKVEEKKRLEEEKAKREAEKIAFEKSKQAQLAYAARSKSKPPTPIPTSSAATTTEDMNSKQLFRDLLTKPKNQIQSSQVPIMMQRISSPKQPSSRQTPRTQIRKDISKELNSHQYKLANVNLSDSATPRTCTIRRHQQTSANKNDYSNYKSLSKDAPKSTRINVNWVNTHPMNYIFRIVTENFLERVYNQVVTNEVSSFKMISYHFMQHVYQSVVAKQVSKYVQTNFKEGKPSVKDEESKPVKKVEESKHVPHVKETKLTTRVKDSKAVIKVEESKHVTNVKETKLTIKVKEGKPPTKAKDIKSVAKFEESKAPYAKVKETKPAAKSNKVSNSQALTSGFDDTIFDDSILSDDGHENIIHKKPSDDELNAAIQIQRISRGCLARKITTQLKSELYENNDNAASDPLFQINFHKYDTQHQFDRALLSRESNRNENEENLFNNEVSDEKYSAAVQIQRISRGCLARKITSQQRQDELKTDATSRNSTKDIDDEDEVNNEVSDEKYNAAVQIQRISRGRLARKITSQQRQDELKTDATSNDSTKDIDDEDEVNNEVSDENYNAAVQIQRISRGRLARKITSQQRQDELKTDATSNDSTKDIDDEDEVNNEVSDEKYSASVQIQRISRGRLARKITSQQRQDELKTDATSNDSTKDIDDEDEVNNEVSDEKYNAAVQIQRISRGRLARKITSQQRQDELKTDATSNDSTKDIEDEVNNDVSDEKYSAAVQIQRISRGRLARKITSQQRQDELKTDDTSNDSTEEMKFTDENKNAAADSSKTSEIANEVESKTISESGKSSSSETKPQIIEELDPSKLLVALQVKDLEVKMNKLSELEKSIQEREKAMLEFQKATEEKSRAMEIALKEMQDKEKSRQLELEEAQKKMKEIENSKHNVTSNLMNTKTSIYNTIPNHMKTNPPGEAFVPPKDAYKISYENEEWVQLWDEVQRAHYWYCMGPSQTVQWHQPGTVPYEFEESGGDVDPSGYDSDGAALTDYSTDHYESGGEEDDDDSVNGDKASIWQEYWDEQAAAKYWYNNKTGEATWTKPDDVPSTTNSASDGVTVDSVSVQQVNKVTEENSMLGTGIGSISTPNMDEWISYLDEATGQEYWYNVITGQTSWA